MRRRLKRRFYRTWWINHIVYYSRLSFTKIPGIFKTSLERHEREFFFVIYVNYVLYVNNMKCLQFTIKHNTIEKVMNKKTGGNCTWCSITRSHSDNFTITD